MTKIELQNIDKEFLGQKVLDDVSFTIESGDFVSILGPANAGKSTLLRIIAGTLKPNSGHIYFDGEDITGYPAQKRNVGVIFQSFALYPNMSVYENIASPLRIKGLSKNEVDKKVKDTAFFLKIEEILEKSPHELSGGEAQRAALARALAKDADVYLMDEPLTNLDYKLRESMKIELKKILQTKKSTILYATPSPEEALVLTNTLIFLDNGRVMQTGPVKECYDAPANVSAGLSYSVPPMNIIDARLTQKLGKKVLTIADKLDLEASHLDFFFPEEEGEYLVGIYPHHIYLESQYKGMITIPLELELQELAGSEMTVRMKWNQSRLTSYIPYEKFLEKKFNIFIDPSDFFIFNKETKELITRYRKGRM